MKDYNVRDHTSQVWNHSLEKSHKNFNTTDFKVIDQNFDNNKQKLKIAEALWIKDLRSMLNTHEKSVQLKLFS